MKRESKNRRVEPMNGGKAVIPTEQGLNIRLGLPLREPDGTVFTSNAVEVRV
ncbi:hypothetical protein [Gorillibacterium sp. sgz5001074]|uniref:hypothetical protein n=1 Tax=Gorillibacterium sp. sgz5001074 TaxID=3446695 RepID=UPI003F67C29B